MSDTIQKLTDYVSRKPARQKHTLDTLVDEETAIPGSQYDYTRVIWLNEVNKIAIGFAKHSIFIRYPFHHIKSADVKKCGIENRFSNRPTKTKTARIAELASAPSLSEMAKIDVVARDSVIQDYSIHGKITLGIASITKFPKYHQRRTNTAIKYRGNWQRYKHLVKVETDYQWHHNQGFFNQYSRKLGKFSYHIDHQFSIKDGLLIQSRFLQ
jgi:hypothetical protein